MKLLVAIIKTMAFLSSADNYGNGHFLPRRFAIFLVIKRWSFRKKLDFYCRITLRFALQRIFALYWREMSRIS